MSNYNDKIKTSQVFETSEVLDYLQPWTSRRSPRLYLAVLFLCISFIISCESNTKSEAKLELAGAVTEFSDCKYLNKATGLSKIVETLPDSLAAVEYYYDGENQLILTHINAGFNCCPGELFTEIFENNGDIIIEEFETEAACKCNCLYDLKIIIDDIKPGNYSFTIIEPYLPDDNEIITFVLGLNEKDEGIIKFKRQGYPWGD